MSADPRAAANEPLRPRSSIGEAMHEEEALGKAVDLRLMVRLWRYVAPYKRQVALTLGLVVPVFAVEVAPAWIIKTGLDGVLGETLVEEPEEGAVGRLLGPVEAILEGPEGVPQLPWLAALYLAVVVTACMPLAQLRATVCAGTERGTPARSAITRAMFA